MKELTIKKETLDVVRQMVTDGQVSQEVAEKYFPEFRESESERIRKALKEYFINSFQNNGVAAICGVHIIDILAWLEKQGGQKPANTVEQKCEESKTKIFDAPTPFEDKLYAFVLACEILVDPSKREFILEHSQEILDAAREQIGKEQSSAWSKEDERLLNNMIIVIKDYYNDKDAQSLISWLKSLKTRCNWKPSDAQMDSITCAVRKMKKSACYDSELVSLLNDLKKLKGE